VALVVITVEIALAAGVLTSRPDAASDRPVTAAPASTTLDRGEEAAINALLVARASALLRRDKDAFLAGIDPKATAFRERQVAVFDNLAGVPLGEWSYDARPDRANALPEDVARGYGARVWASEVEVRYALAGYDALPTVQRQYLTFVRRGQRWYVGNDEDLRDSGLATARNLWDFGPVVADRTPRVLVLGHPASRPLMAELKALADAAAPRVTAVWGSWRQRVVVLVPADADEAAALVPTAGDLRQLAAITAAELDATGGPPLGERIVVNPGPFGKLSAFGRRVVVQHEITHVATRAVTSDATPYWLSEGFADYVGYLGQDASPTSVARELTVEVRAGKVPERLPGATEFAPDNPRLAQAYEASWLACRLIAERVGRQGLVRFYRAVSAGPGDSDAALDSGLRSVLGVTTEQFLALWRQYLRTQLAR
jgi:hypothetical protein